MKRVLVVDDNPLNANLARVILARAGHAVTLANGAAEALHAVAAAPPQVIVTDINMPGVSGLALVERVRALGLRPPPRLVAYTALAMEEERRDIEAAGFHAIVVKPATRATLLAAIEAADAFAIHAPPA